MTNRVGACVALLIASTLACTPADRPESPLEQGELLPEAFLELSVDRKRQGIRGVFEKQGRRVRFFTMRGPRTALHERLSGAPTFEMNACFVNEAGYSLVQTVGGHEVVIPECAGPGGEIATDSSSPTTQEEMELARAAMEAIAALRFREAYRAHKEVLTSWLSGGNRTVVGDLF